jgi:hypothetical protein
MLFLAIQDQLNEFDGEFDNDEEMAAINTTDKELKLRSRERLARRIPKNVSRTFPALSLIQMALLKLSL